MAMSQNRGTPGTLSHSWLMDGYSPQIYGHNGWLMDGYSPQIYGHNGWLMDGYSMLFPYPNHNGYTHFFQLPGQSH